MTDEQRAAIYADVKRHTLQQVQEVLNRQISNASGLLHPSDRVLLACEIAAGMICGAQAAAIAMRKEDADPRTLASDVECGILRMARQNHDRILRTGEAMRRGERVTEAVQ